MIAPQLLPSRDLLAQVQGVEQGLRRGRRARTLGILLAAIQVTILVANSSWLDALVNGQWNAVWDRWPLLVSLFVLVLAVLMASWARFWMHESRQPFRYTYSIAPFTPVPGDPEQPLLTPIDADLRERLSLRIRRLLLLDGQDEGDAQAAAHGADGARTDSHVHVSGNYAIRRRPPDTRWFVEITPWVRIGGPEQAARLAVPVKFALPDSTGNRSSTAAPSDEPPPLDERYEQYEQILERTYFSVATEIYRQIKEDVSGKIALLPNRWFRASALFHEAEDYARSNTLDAYSQARDLYAAALRLSDPGSAPLPASRVRRPGAAAWRLSLLAIGRARRFSSRVVPRLGRAGVLAARAQVGYANTLLDTWVLAALSGLRGRAFYEAAPTARRAKDCLGQIAPDVAGRNDSLFDAEVALAFAYARLDARAKGKHALKTAGARDPLRADCDPRYLFVQAELDGRALSQIPLYRRAVELDPRFEAAQFQLAHTSERLWRTRQTLEQSVARSVFRQYGEVLRLNPGNVAAWANCGYMWWLLGDAREARRHFEGGRRFKEIKQEAYVAELDHGLARIAAEDGRFGEAYAHYIDTVSALLSQGWAQGGYDDYHFGSMTPAVLARFQAYRDAVRAHHAAPSAGERERTTPRIRDSVYAFALYDYAKACFHYYLRTRDYTVLEKAHAACTRAVSLNERFVLPHHLLFYLDHERLELGATAEPPGRHLDRVEELEPGWPEAARAILAWDLELARTLRDEAQQAGAEAADTEREIAELERALRTSAERTEWGESGAAPGVQHTGLWRLHHQARELRAREHSLVAKARERERDAADLPRRLLPHAWLWSSDGKEFNWRAVSARTPRRELRWERSLERFHVHALFAYCQFESAKQPADHRLDALLDLLEERFLPNDIELLAFRLALARGRGNPSAQNDLRRRMDAVVQDWLASDQYPFGALRWLDLDSDEACDRFAEMAVRKGLSPYLYHWLGQQLLARWRASLEGGSPNPAAEAGALAALRNATGIRQPDLLLELADAFAELGRADESERLYERAARSQAPAPLLMSLADRFEDVGRFDTALELLDRAQALTTSKAFPPELDQQRHVAEARALLALGRFEAARDELAAISARGGGLGGCWRATMVERLLETKALGEREAQLRLRDWLGAAQRTAVREGDSDAAEDAGQAALLLSRRPDASTLWRPLDEEAALHGRMPVSRPIALETHGGLFPDDADTPVVGRLIENDIPAIRETIRRETGVVVPGFRLGTAPDLKERGYRILVDDALAAHGRVPDDAEDPYAFILARCADAIRERLPSFVDAQSVETLLREWASAAPETREPLVETATSDPGRARVLVTLLKALVADGIPIADPTVAVEVCGAAGPGAEVQALAETVRVRMRTRLRGRDDRHVHVPPNLEGAIADVARSNGASRDVATIPEATLGTLRSQLQALDHRPGRFAYVVSSPELRPLVQRLVALDAPATPVLSEDEVAPRPRGVSSALTTLRRS